MRMSAWSSDVCSSDLGFFVEAVAEEPESAALRILDAVIIARQPAIVAAPPPFGGDALGAFVAAHRVRLPAPAELVRRAVGHLGDHLDRLRRVEQVEGACRRLARLGCRSEEHTSELQSLMRISYAVFCLKKTKQCDTQTLKYE